MLYFCILLLFLLSCCVCEEKIAKFPFEFSANIEITAHLIDESSEFPPRTRHMTVYFDYKNKKARADIESGYEAAKIYIRRYDEKKEYMVRLPPINDCKRSYLGELMPFPDIPDAQYIGSQTINDVECDYFLHEDFEARIHIYISLDGIPVRLIQESYEDNISTPLLTYDYTDVVIGEPDSSWFELPEPYEHDKCMHHRVGFPYLHIFHYFVKF